MPLSYSQLRAYQTCPRQFEYAFVKKLKSPPTPESCFGVSMHTTLQKWGNLEIAETRRRGGAPPVQTSLLPAQDTALPGTALTLKNLLALWSTSFIVDAYDRKIEADFDRARGEEALRAFYVWWTKEPRNVLAAEKGFSIVTEEGIIVTGRFDRVEQLSDGRLRIVDFKTGGPRSQESVDRDFQLSLYALAAGETFGATAAELVFLFLGEGCEEVRTIRTEAELRGAETAIRLLAERIASRDYHPTPSREACRHCPYRRVCDVAAV